MKIITINYFSVFSYLKPKYSQHSIQRKRKRQHKTVFSSKCFVFVFCRNFNCFNTVQTMAPLIFSLVPPFGKNKFTGFEVLSSLVLMNDIFQMRSIRSIHEFLILEKSN